MRKTSLGSWKAWVFTAALTALSIILTRYASINIGTTIRIGFGRLPIMLASVWFGPILGAICGGAADIIGALMSTGWNPVLTLPAVVCGIIPFFLFILFRVRNSVSSKEEVFPNVLKTGASVVISKVVTQGILMTLLLAYVFKQTPEQLAASLGVRNLITVGEAIAETAAIYVLYTNKAINRIIG